MSDNRKLHKKLYKAPAIRKVSVEEARRELDNKGDPQDPEVQKMNRDIVQKLTLNKKPKSGMDKSA